jgi:hypothetical protein
LLFQELCDSKRATKKQESDDEYGLHIFIQNSFRSCFVATLEDVTSEFFGNAEVVKYPSCNHASGKMRHGDLMARRVDTVGRRPHPLQGVWRIMELAVETGTLVLNRQVASNRLASRRMSNRPFWWGPHERRPDETAWQ